MKNTQLIKLLETFNPKEFKRFNEFISSPYFNKNKNVIKLFRVIKNAYPGFKPKEIAREKVFSKIFPSKKYDGNTLRVLTHLLYENARKFLVHNLIEKKIFDFKRDLVYALFERELYNESIKEIDKANSELEKSDIREENYFFYKYSFEDFKLHCLRNMKQEKYEKYITKSRIESPFKNLTSYYFLHLLAYYSMALNHNMIYNINIDTNYFDKLFSCFDIKLFNDSPLIQIHYNIIMINKPNDEKHSYIVKNLVKKHEKSLDLVALHSACTNMQNFCFRKISDGETRFRHELFEIMKMTLEKKFYKYNPYIHQNFYKKVLRTATELKEYEWADNFIESYKNELHPDFSEDVYLYCKAFLEAEKNNLEKSLDYLSSPKTDDILIKTDMKLLQARIFYELNWYDVLSSAIDSIRHFLKDNKFIQENKRIQLTTFVNLLSSLNNVKLKKDELKIMELKDKIHKTKDLYWKDWFIKKVEELEAA